MGEDASPAELQPIFSELPDDPKLVDAKPSRLAGLKKEFQDLPPVQLAEKMDIAGRLQNLAADPQTYVMLQKGLGIALFAGAVAGIYSHDVPAQFILKAPEAINMSAGIMAPNPILSGNAKVGIDMLESFGIPLLGDAATALGALMDSHPKAEEFFVRCKERVKEEVVDFGYKHDTISKAMQTFNIQSPMAAGAQNG